MNIGISDTDMLLFFKKRRNAYEDPSRAGKALLLYLKLRRYSRRKEGIYMLNEVIKLVSAHYFFKILIIAVLMDTILGVLRAIKEHKFNSCVGIDGAIRKVAMLLSVVFLVFVDSIVNIDFLFMVPEQYLQYIGLNRLGICELFSLLYILYEIVSILKNMTLCGLPVPAKLKTWIQKFLDDMTDELPEETAEELHNTVKQEGE